MTGTFTKPLETSTRKKIDILLNSLNWNTNEDFQNCNVFTGRVKKSDQRIKLKGKMPDYVLYKSGTDEPIGIIEAKKKGESIEDALEQAIDYAKPLGVNIVFAIDGTFIKAYHIGAQKELTIDNEPVRELISETRLLRFIKEGPNIEETAEQVKHTREELLKIFEWANALLRKEGLRNLDRFVEFSNLLFIKIISEIEDDREKRKLPRRLPKDICWESFCDEKDPKKMLNYINNTVLKEGLAKEYNHTDDIFQEKLKIQNPETLKRIVTKLSTLTLINTESEIKGDAFEYFLKSLVSGNDLGEYFTPRHIVKFMVSLVNPKCGNTVFDPFCGTGGFLIEAFRYLKANIDENDENLMKTLKEKTFFGVELTDTYKIAKMNMIITGDGHNNIVQSDTARNIFWEKIISSYKETEIVDALQRIKEKGFDVVFSNIPYGQTTDFGNTYPISSNQGDSIFIQFIIQALGKNGKAAVIIPEGFLFKPEHIKVRQYLLENCSVDAVISLPAGVFLPYTMSKTDILVFEKSKITKTVWFYVLENDGFELATKRKRIKKNDIPDVLKKWAEKQESTKSWNVDFSRISANNFILEAKTYKPITIHTSSLTKLSDLLTQVKEPVTIEDSKIYKQITVKLNGKGAILRRLVKGEEILTKRQFVAKTDNVIVSRIDARNGAYAVVGEELNDAVVSQDFPLYEINQEKIRVAYLGFFLKFHDFKVMLALDSKGTTNRQRIDSQDFLDLEVPVPTLSEQDVIIERLRKQESILVGLESSLASMTNGFIDQSIFENLGNANIVSIGEVTVKKQYGMTQSVIPETVGVSYIRITDIDAFGRIQKVLPEISVSDDELNRYKVNEGDLLIARTGATIGKCTVIGKVERDIIFASYLIRFVLDKEKVNPAFLSYFLLSNKGQFEVLLRAQRTTNININAEQLSSIQFPLPSLQDQEAIVKQIEQKLMFVGLLEENIKITKKTILDIINHLCI